MGERVILSYPHSPSNLHSHPHLRSMKTNLRKYFLSFKNRNEISDEKLIVNDDFHHQDNYLMI